MSQGVDYFLEKMHESPLPQFTKAEKIPLHKLTISFRQNPPNVTIIVKEQEENAPE